MSLCLRRSVTLLLAVVLSGCRAEGGAAGDGSAAASTLTLGGWVPAGPDVTALVAVKKGDALADFIVESVGAVRPDGAIPVRLERNGTVIRLAVTLVPADDEPRAPAKTARYAVYFETVSDGVSAREEDCMRACEALAEKLRETEHRVPAPAGMKAPKKSGKPA